MDLFYYHAPEGNFGDDLNAWLWQELLPLDAIDPSVTLSGIGTILAPFMPQRPRWIIAGSGTGYGLPTVDLLGPNVAVSFVRGPLTAQVLGLPRDSALTDGAIVLPSLDRFPTVPPQDRGGPIFVPHISAFRLGNWHAAARLAGVELVDPRQDSHLVIDRIRQASLVLADSMHAAIIADAFRVPWVAVSTSTEILAFKWLDWAQSVGVDYEPLPLASSSMAEALRNAESSKRVMRPDQFADLASFARAHHQRHAAGKPPARPSRLAQAGIKSLKRLRGTALDQASVERAARSLQQAKATTGILSDAATSLSLREEALRRIAMIPELAEQLVLRRSGG